jgi:hypothetical protein
MYTVDRAPQSQSNAPSKKSFTHVNRNAWKALAGTDAAAAMQQYVNRVAEWFPPAGAHGGSDEVSGGGGGGGGGGEGGGELSFGAAGLVGMGAIGLDGRCVHVKVEGWCELGFVIGFACWT